MSELYRQLLAVDEHSDIDTDDLIEAAVALEELENKTKKKCKRKQRNVGTSRRYVDYLFH